VVDDTMRQGSGPGRGGNHPGSYLFGSYPGHALRLPVAAPPESGPGRMA
jgi:hypothetical protein